MSFGWRSDCIQVSSIVQVCNLAAFVGFGLLDLGRVFLVVGVDDGELGKVVGQL